MADPAAPVLLAGADAVWAGAREDRRLLRNADVLIDGGRIAAIGPDLPRPPGIEVVDASGWIVLPGLVNAHHHLSQQLTRTLAVGHPVEDWLAASYPRWSLIDAETAWAGARCGLAEMVLTGVTTVADLTYYFPRGHADIFDAQVRAAGEIGCRLVAVRGGLRDVGEAVRRRVGSAVDETVESAETLLAELDRVHTAYHDPGPDAMVKVAVGLTEPLWTEPALMTRLADFARERDLRLHTHLHPRPSDHTQAGMAVSERLAEWGWWGPHVWVAHGTRLSAAEQEAMAHHGVALATCPSSNARLATAIPPAWPLHRAGGIVAVGVDGAASNDGGDFLAECRLTWQLQRMSGAPGLTELTPDVVWDWATAGGAQALGWPGLGELTVGGPADVACFDLSGPEFAGASEPLDALLLCGIGRRAESVYVAGRPVVRGGRLVADQGAIGRTGHLAARRLRDRAAAKGW
ncbi:amidohydrolase family protein [Amycolatopsis jejuensis]|uniref:amidohydrolase family protein n=1 Tax=Amycolatopsis jejuensis TaxID=330084 RepID=UPI00068E1D4C|nr:amidohydrolase family protein [Amycolatopsis jejuensis]